MPIEIARDQPSQRTAPMRRFLVHSDEATYAALRIVVAFLYLSHGLRWLFGTFGGRPASMFSLTWTAGVIETLCGTLVGIGLWTPWAAFIASGEMAVAYFMVHYPRARFPIQNGGEITVAICFVFLYIATHGAGRISLDAVRAAPR
jgi:putative oxidoreductase